MTIGITEYQIRVYDRSGNQTSLISSTAGKGPLVSCEFSLLRDGGCEKFSMRVDRDRLQGTIGTRALLEFWAQPVGGTLTRYWYGVVTSRPWANGLSDEVEYNAEGLVRQARERRVVKYYVTKTVDLMVKDMIADLAVGSDISSATTGVSITTPVTVGDFEAEYITYADAMKLLANVQGSAHWGVDQNGVLYFEDEVTTTTASYFAGRHLAELSGELRTDKMVNRYYLQSKKVVGGGALTISREDIANITAHGLSETVKQIPHLSDNDDIYAWGGTLLTDTAGEQTTVHATPNSMSEFIFPRGKARIVALDGTETTLPIVSITYRMDGGGTLSGELTLGDSNPPTFSDEMQEILREVRVGKSNSISLNKREHSSEKDFIIESVVDAGKQGHLNMFTDALTDTKAIDPAFSSHLWNRSGDLICPLDFGQTIITSNDIPTGRTVDTVRLHTWFDSAGRINFTEDDDISTFFFQDTGAWRVQEGGTLAEATATASTIWYEDKTISGTPPPAGQNPFRLPNNYRLSLDMREVLSGNTVTIYFSYFNSSNHNKLEINRNFFTSTTTFTFKKVVAGVTTTLETGTISPLDFTVKISAKDSAIGQSSYNVYQANDGSLLYASGLYSMPVTPGYRVGLAGFYVSTTGGHPVYRINWFEIDTYGSPTVEFSRDSGTTWTTATSVTTGKAHGTFNTTAGGTGTNLRARFKYPHPIRLKAWALSFNPT